MRRLLLAATAAALAAASAPATALGLQLGHLHLRKAKFSLDWEAKAAGLDRDSLSISGTFNRSGIFADLTGAEVTLAVNGSSFPPLTLDASGNAASAPGSSPALRVKVRAKSGKWSFSAEGLDLDEILGIQNQAGAGTAPVPVVLQLVDAGLVVHTSSGVYEFAYSTVADVETRGSFASASDATLSGLVLPLKARALESDDYVFTSHDVSFSAQLVGIGGGPVIPADGPDTFDALLTVGSTSFAIDFQHLLPSGSGADSVFTYDGQNGAIGGLSLSIDNRRRRLTFTLPHGSEVGIPPAGPGNGTAHTLPVLLDLLTPAGSLSIETVVGLTRASETGARWRY